MTPNVAVYGFGSAFRNADATNDVDFLIVHSGTDPACCQFAIQCKQSIRECVARAHVTMLSKSEEAHFQFIETARAIYLGNIRNDYFNADVAALCYAHSLLKLR